VNLEPLVAVYRSGQIESLHLGAVAVVDATGRLRAHAGDPDFVTYLRSAAKPIQALSLVESGAADGFGFEARQLAVVCGSHSGSDVHAEQVRAMLTRIGLDEFALRCGAHRPIDKSTAARLEAAGAGPTPARHNCSGKHTGMLAQAVHRGLSTADYLDPDHPVQETIVGNLMQMTSAPRDAIGIGVDGCSAPTFALPLQSAAFAFARLADPSALAPSRQASCRRIVAAMQAHPEMVGGEASFDTRAMRSLAGKLISKGGAEGYLGLAILPDALYPGSPALGVAMKIADGDSPRGRGPAAFGLLRELGLIADGIPPELRSFGAMPVLNIRELHIGEVLPVVKLEWDLPLR
jgi:L-asparaginase II